MEDTLQPKNKQIDHLSTGMCIAVGNCIENFFLKALVAMVKLHLTFLKIASEVGLTLLVSITAWQLNEEEIQR